MDEVLKKRLIGATVLVSLAVIFVPMILEPEPIISPRITQTNIPERPKDPFPREIEPVGSPSNQEANEAAVEGIIRLEANAKPDDSKISQPATVKESVKATPKTDVTGPKAWVIQVGSFSNRDNADRLVNVLQKEQFAAFIETAEVQGKSHFRVLVGPEIDRKRADEMLNKINQAVAAQKISGKVRRYP